jgi:uncharacterized protein (DUF488 family)
MPTADSSTDAAATVWTIGHSTRTAADFRAVLAAHRIELVADVRRFPGSRRLPHFATESLQTDLKSAGILYQWLPALGGRRTAKRNAPAAYASAWRHAAFRAYAEHVETEEFAGGLIELLMLAHGLRTAIMCAELLWWRCHRRIIADVLTVLNIDVMHIRDENGASLHELSPPVRIVRGALSYAPLH